MSQSIATFVLIFLSLVFVVQAAATIADAANSLESYVRDQAEWLTAMDVFDRIVVAGLAIICAGCALLVADAAWRMF